MPINPIASTTEGLLSKAPPIIPLEPDPPPLDSSDWPKYMVDAYHYFTEETVDGTSTAHPRNWGDTWLECVREFVGFQWHAGFPDGGPSFPPATEVRPSEIGVWMKNRRVWRDVELADQVKFSQQWWAWWSSLQPDSRSGDDKPTIDMDWAKLRKAGKNGFLLVVLSLVWWGKALGTDGGWQKAVAEVSDVLGCVKGTVPIIPERGPLIGSNAANIADGRPSKRHYEGVAIAEGSSKRRKRQ